MRTHLRLGRLLGVPIGLNWGVLLVAALLLWILVEALPTISPRQPSSAYWFAAVVGVLGFLISLVGHELGHSYVARRNGVHVAEITLWLFGGVAKLEGDADDPGAEFRIAAAGPAMSGLIAAAVGLLAWWATAAESSRVLVALLIWLSAINVVLAVSNLLPAFPLDGGRMLRAVIWRRSNRKLPATRTASLIGQVLAGVMVLGGVALVVWVSLWNGLWLVALGLFLFVALGLFLFVAARSEWSASAPAPELLQVQVRQLGRRLPPPLAPGASVAELERVLAADRRTPLVPVTDDRGSVAALVTRDAVQRVPPAQRPVVPIRSLAEPLVSLPRVGPSESLETVLGRLGRGRSWWALVTDGDGVGSVLCSEDVDEILERAGA